MYGPPSGVDVVSTLARFELMVFSRILCAWSAEPLILNVFKISIKIPRRDDCPASVLLSAGDDMFEHGHFLFQKLGCCFVKEFIL